MSVSYMKRIKNYARLTIFIFLLAGCGAKQPDTPPLEMISPPQTDTTGEDLSHDERAALKSTGAIDRAVPKKAMPEVEAQYKYFLRKGRNTMCSFSKRSEQYLGYARKVFRERGMPEELANLAIVESGYRPNAISRAGAAGAWQFMPATGRMYGLKQDWWQDERLDPYKATEAAADYLQKLYDNFGDWPTAIAAYNAGEGKILRAKEGVGARDFFEVTEHNHKLDDKTQLREETRQYVPRFMAVTKIMRNLPDLGFDPINPENAEKVNRLTARPGTDLRDLSRAANMSWSEFQAMNQHHKRAITCTDRETFVYVPERVKELAKSYLCSPQQARYAGWQPVKVTNSRDSLAKLSKRANIPLAKLQAANPGLDRLRSGQIILAPASIKMPAFNDARSRDKAVLKERMVAGASHTFKPNDTLFAVAKRYNTTVDALKAHNGIADAGKIRAGAVLAIPGKNVKPAQAGPTGKIGGKKAVYTVQAKDNLWSIAKKHKITVEELKRLNRLGDNKLKPGAQLVVAN